MISTTVPENQLELIKEIKKGQMQKSFGNKYDTVMKGRDIGTRIFPNVEVKFYLTATPEVRTKRRVLWEKDNRTYEQILKKLKERDKIEVKAKSIIIPEDAIIIDTSNKNFDKVNNIMYKVSREKLQHGERE